MSITGEAPGRPPVKCGAPLTDITCGILAAMGILAAYAHRLKTGRGQMVETSLLEAGIVQTYWQSAIALATGIAPGPMGSAHPLERALPGVRDRRRLDRDRRQQPDELAERAGGARTPWSSPPTRAFATTPTAWPTCRSSRTRSPPTSSAAPAPTCSPRFEDVGVPAGPVYDVLQMQADPQVRAREMVVEVEHAKLGPVKTLGLPVKFSDTPGGVRTGAPVYGQHTREVLRRARLLRRRDRGAARRRRDRTRRSQLACDRSIRIGPGGGFGGLHGQGCTLRRRLVTLSPLRRQEQHRAGQPLFRRHRGGGRYKRRLEPVKKKFREASMKCPVAPGCCSGPRSR